MRITIPGGGHITIDDNSLDAEQIRSGHSYQYDKGQLTVGAKLTQEQQIEAIKSLEDVKIFLLQLIKKT